MSYAEVMNPAVPPAPPLPFPSLDDAAPLDAAAAMAAQVAATLQVAAALAQSGRRLDLEGLDRMVGQLCARTLDLPPAQGRQLRPRLISLQAELDALEGLLAPP